MKNKEVTDEEVIKAIKRARNPATIDYVEKKLSLRNKAVAWRIIKRLESLGLIRQSGEFKSLGKRGFAPAVYEVVTEKPTVIHRRISTHQPADDVKRDELTLALFGEYRKEAA